MFWTSARSIRLHLTSRLVINAFNIILVGLLARGYTVMEPRYRDYADATWNAISLTAPLFSLIWSTISAILLLLHLTGTKLGTHHPSVEVSLDLVSWLLFAIFGGFLIAQVSVPEGQSFCIGTSRAFRYTYCDHGGETKQKLDIASCAFMMVNMILHLVVFGFACHAVKVWRRTDWGQARADHELKTSRQSSSEA